MPSKKEFFETKPVCKVTFTIAAKTATEVSVLGDFKDLFELPTQKSSEIKYVVNGTFINEAEADGLVYNDFAGAENSVLIL